MKAMQKLFAGAVIVTAALVITGCGPSREYSYSHQPPPPRARVNFSLIISPTPGFVISRYPDGRSYYRSPQGYIYWRGYDNRFYLDQSYLGRVRYNQREYNEWRRYNNGNRNRRSRRY